jgi:hypothetical protein
MHSSMIYCNIVPYDILLHYCVNTEFDQSIHYRYGLYNIVSCYWLFFLDFFFISSSSCKL